MSKTTYCLTALVLNLALAVPALAQSPVPSSISGNAKIICVGTAVAAREASLGTGISIYTQAITTAYSARAEALALAYASGNGAQVKTGIKTAWSAFSTSVKSAAKTWRTGRLAAWNKFNLAAKACKAPATAIDTANAAGEVSGQ